MGKSGSSEVTSTVATRPRSIQCDPGSVPTIVRSELTILFRTLLFSLKAGVFVKGKREGYRVSAGWLHLRWCHCQLYQPSRE
jgi:hypothetical protein